MVWEYFYLIYYIFFLSPINFHIIKILWQERYKSKSKGNNIDRYNTMPRCTKFLEQVSILSQIFCPPLYPEWRDCFRLCNTDNLFVLHFYIILSWNFKRILEHAANTNIFMQLKNISIHKSISWLFEILQYEVASLTVSPLHSSLIWNSQ
jgi:hypothetical protein